MNIELPPLDTAQPPAFETAEACRAWCAALPLTNPIQVQAQLLRQLHLLNRHATDSATRLAMLELLREPLHFVQEENAARFAGRPLPLAPLEQAAWEANRDLWRALVLGYLRCLVLAAEGDAARVAQASALAVRCLNGLRCHFLDALRAGTTPESPLWRQAHVVYAEAERLGVADGPVMAAYGELALLATANLHELTPRMQVWVARWANRWGGKLRVLAEPPPASPALPLCVDLGSVAPADFRPRSGAQVRWLDTAELRKSLKTRLKLLAEAGEANTPARLGLGEDCTQPACGELLRRIYPRWVKGGVLRRHDRHPQQGPCRFVVGTEAIHYYLSGRQPFKSPGPASNDELRRQQEELAVYGRVRDRIEADYSRNHGFEQENWETMEDWGTLDHGSGGLRLERPLSQSGGRLGTGQLVAVQPAGAGGLLLGAVRWARTTDAALTAGIQLFPGLPEPVAVRATGVTGVRVPYRPGFMLPALAVLEVSACALLPPGSFKPNRIMEVWRETTRRIRLLELLERGGDYERVTYVDIAG